MVGFSGSIIGTSNRTQMTEPDKPRRRQHDGVHLAVAHQPEASIDVAADRHHIDLQTEAPRVILELHGPPRGPGADPKTVAKIANRSPIRTSRVSSRGGTAASSSSGTAAVGRSFSECTATSIPPTRSASRTALTKTPVPPISVNARGSTSPVVVIPTKTESTPWAARSRAT